MDSFSNSTTTNNKSQQRQIVYRLAVGSVDAFERKLEEAQRAVGMNQSQEIPVQYTAESTLATEVLGVIPSLMFMGAAFYFFRFAAGSMMGGGANSGGRGGGMGGIFQIGKSTAKKVAKEDIKINFSHVAGCDEAKKEIMEFVDFLKEPARFTKLGAKIPKGALLCGPPGTGKTLLAKAVAGEAGVPFYSISGSDFIGTLEIFREVRVTCFVVSIILTRYVVLRYKKCLLVWDRLVYEICSRKLERIPHVSFSLMRLMLLADNVAAEEPAETMNARTRSINFLWKWTDLKLPPV
jgi:hypothetical protein